MRKRRKPDAKKLAVFDVDGTILDSWEHARPFIAAYSRKNGLPMPSLEAIKRGYGEPHKHDFKWGLPLGEQEKHLYAAWDLADSAIMKGPAAPLFHGVEAALHRLQDQGYTLAVVTSKPEAPLLHFFEYHGIGKMFSAWRARDDIKKRGEKEKPAPDMLLSVMRDLSFLPEDTVMVGDTVMDIRMGKAAGAYTIGVTWGAHLKEDLEKAGAHVVVETDFDDVVTEIGRHDL